MIIHNFEQGSEGWKLFRKGRPTASNFSKIFTPAGKVSASAEKYIITLVRECIMDDPNEPDLSTNKDIKWGNDHEPEARDKFMSITGLEVEQVGFITRKDGVIGCSPDGLIVGDSGEFVGGLEIKCPRVDNHITRLLAGTLPDEHKLQVHGSLAVTGLSHWYYMSYYPELKPMILKVEPDEFTKKLSNALDDFLEIYKTKRAEILEKILP